MRTFRNYVQAEKARREENGDEGFSLIELIIVVVILGILAAIAIPIFANIQADAQAKALDAAAANGATAAAVASADAPTSPTIAEAAASGGSGDITTALVSGTTTADICVSAAKTGATTRYAGPGAKADGTACK